MKHQSHIFLSVALLGVGCVTSCVATKPTAQPAAQVKPVWPPPPDQPRIVYVRTLTGPADLGVEVTTWRKFVNFLTGLGGAKENLIKPFGLALDEKDDLCLTDTGAGVVSYFDHKVKSYTRWEQLNKIHFVLPVAIAKVHGLFYVADSGLKKILAFDERGKFRFDISNGLLRPAGLAASEKNLFVADAAAHRIVIFDLEGKFIAQFGQRGEKPGEFNCPTHVALDRLGQVYVTDSMNGRVQVFNSEGRLRSVIGSSGDTPGHFGRPKGVAVDGFGHVYVADALFDNIQVFDLAGNLLMMWGEAGAGAGEFWLPEGLAINHSNELYVADSYNQRVQVFKYIGTP